MSQTKVCRYCGNILYRDAQTCEYCGKYLYKEHDNPDLVCEKCKSPVNTDDNFCQKCGAVFNLPEVSYDEPMRNILGIPYNIGIFLTSIAISIAITVIAVSAKEQIAVGEIFLYLGITFVAAEILLYIYFLPTIQAIEKNNPNALMIYIVNLLFGITIVGWIAAFVLAVQGKPKRG